MILSNLILFIQWVSALKAAPLKVGYNDPGKCDTEGSSLDYAQDATPTFQKFLVGGVTKSKNMVDPNEVEC